MIDELEVLHRYIDATVDPDPDLALARGRLLAAIEEVTLTPESRRHSRRSSRPAISRRTATSLGGLVAVGVAIAVVVLLIATPPAHHPAVSTAKAIATPKPFPSHLPVGAQLRLVADRATTQPIPSLGPDQALYAQANLSIVASVNSGAAEATIGLSVQKWSTPTGQTCTSLTAQPAQFASPAAQAAWGALHLLVTPNPSTASQCLQGGSGGSAAPDAITGAGQLLNVSTLPSDSATLAQELENGTTGIPALDQLEPDLAAPNPGFQRAAMLLIGPTLGDTPQFESTLYQAIALLPGVTALGPMTTHDGEPGQGFASGPGTGQSTIVVEPSNGQLLEVRDLDDSNSLSSIATNYLEGGPMYVDEYSSQLQWLDPTGPPSVIGLSALPAGLPVYVFATTKAGLSYDAALTPVRNLVQPYSRDFTTFQSLIADPSNPSSPGSFQWSFAESGPDVSQFMQTLQASGLFASVSEI